jgi:hypothetical protein
MYVFEIFWKFLEDNKICFYIFLNRFSKDIFFILFLRNVLAWWAEIWHGRYSSRIIRELCNIAYVRFLFYVQRNKFYKYLLNKRKENLEDGMQ